MMNNVSKLKKNLGTAGIAVATTLAVSAAVLPFSPLMAKAAPGHVAADLAEININNGFAELVRAVKPAVVNISVTSSSPAKIPGFGGQSPELEEFFKRFFGELPEGLQRGPQQPNERKSTAVGSGFIIDPDGLVVTNNHVIEHADEIEVVFDDGTRIPATLKGMDRKTDLALLQITTDKPLPYVTFGDSEEAEVGDWVIAIGNPFGLGGTTTSGIISARGRDIRSGPLDDFIQIDAPINRGNSGGPLFNIRGEVIGVNSAIYSPNGGSVGIGFAIPSSMVSNVVAQLSDSGVVQRGFLGVHIQTVTAEIADSLGMENPIGALVTQVVADSPAEKAGIEAGDVIIGYDGKEVGKMRDLPKLVALTEDSSLVNVDVWRNEQRMNLEVAITSNSEEKVASSAIDELPSTGKLGLALGELDRDARQKYGIDEQTNGVVVTAVDPEGAAASRGLREGDIIRRVGSQPVDTPDQVVDAVKATNEAEKDSVLLLVERDNQVRFVAVPMKS